MVRKSKSHGQYFPKRPQTVTIAESTLQERLRLSGFTALSKEAMLAVVASGTGLGPHVMKSIAASLEPVLKPTDTNIEVRYCSTSRVQELIGLVHPRRQRRASSMQEHILKRLERWCLSLRRKATRPGT